MDNTDVFKNIVDKNKNTVFAEKAKKLKKDFICFSYHERALKIVKIIYGLQQFISQNRTVFINALTNDFSRESTEVDHNIRNGSKIVVTKCRSLLNEYKVELKKEKLDPQTFQHLNNVAYTVALYLTRVSQSLSEMISVRNRRLKSQFPLGEMLKSSETFLRRRGKVAVTEEKPIAVNTFVTDLQEQKLLENENYQLYDELTSVSKDIHLVGHQLNELTDLQEILTEKVLEQDKYVDNIFDDIASTTENVREANKHLVEAIQQTAITRLLSLTFFFLMALALLFINWYKG